MAVVPANRAWHLKSRRRRSSEEDGKKVARGASFPLHTALEGAFKALTLSLPPRIALAHVAGVPRSASPPRGGEDSTAAEAAAVENVARRVVRAVGTEIPAAEDDPAARRAVLTARSGLAAQLAAIRPQGARRWSQEAARPEPWAACQAVEYAREAGRVAMQLPTLATDHDRVEAVKGAVSLARFGWELAGKEQGAAEERAHAREIIDKTERALRFAINDIADPQGKRAAIQARQRLYKAGVQEYRAARREADRQRRRAAERDEGVER